MSALLERLQASLAELAGQTRESHRVAPFTVFIDPLRTNKYLSFAVPDARAGADALAAALPDVAALFEARERRKRTEHMEVVCPALAGVVEQAGWTLSERVAVMVCTPESFAEPPAPDGLVVEPLEPDATEARIREVWSAQDRAFGEPDQELTPELVARWRERAARELGYAGLLDGEVVGTAIALPVVLGVSELVGVATVPEHRGKGIAGHLTARAVAAAFEAGAELAWLSAADEAAGRVYTRAGFRLEGWQRGYEGP